MLFWAICVDLSAVDAWHHVCLAAEGMAASTVTGQVASKPSSLVFLESL